MAFLAPIASILARLLPILLFAIPVTILGGSLIGAGVGVAQAIPNIGAVVGILASILPILLLAPVFVTIIDSIISTIRERRKE